jgi:hypothetical protein
MDWNRLYSAGMVDALGVEIIEVFDICCGMPGARRRGEMSSVFLFLGDGGVLEVKRCPDLPSRIIWNIASPLGAVVRFSYPFEVIRISSSIRTPPTGR